MARNPFDIHREALRAEFEVVLNAMAERWDAQVGPLQLREFDIYTEARHSGTNVLIVCRHIKEFDGESIIRNKGCGRCGARDVRNL